MFSTNIDLYCKSLFKSEHHQGYICIILNNNIVHVISMDTVVTFTFPLLHLIHTHTHTIPVK